MGRITEIIERLCEVRFVRFFARIEQGHRAKGGDSALLSGVIRPGPLVGILRRLKIADAQSMALRTSPGAKSAPTTVTADTSSNAKTRSARICGFMVLTIIEFNS